MHAVSRGDKIERALRASSLVAMESSNCGGSNNFGNSIHFQPPYEHNVWASFISLAIFEISEWRQAPINTELVLHAASMADQETQQTLVDSSPISPIRPNHVRQNSLEKHLQSRPDPQELKDRHILLDTKAAP
jgi:hypothetical protein